MILSRLDDGGLLRAGDRGQLAHHAVDPNTHVQTLLLRREVDVGGAEIEGLRDGSVDEDHRRGVVVEVEDARVVLALRGVRDDFLDGDGGVVVELRDRVRDRVGSRDADAHRHADREPELVREHHVGRVGDHDEHAPVVEEANRERHVAAGQALREHQCCRDVDRGHVELDELELVLLGEDTRDRRRGRDSHLEQDLTESELRPQTLQRRERSRAARTSRPRRERAASRGQATGSWAS